MLCGAETEMRDWGHAYHDKMEENLSHQKEQTHCSRRSELFLPRYWESLRSRGGISVGPGEMSQVPGGKEHFRQKHSQKHSFSQNREQSGEIGALGVWRDTVGDKYKHINVSYLTP